MWEAPTLSLWRDIKDSLLQIHSVLSCVCKTYCLSLITVHSSSLSSQNCCSSYTVFTLLLFFIDSIVSSMLTFTFIQVFHIRHKETWNQNEHLIFKLKDVIWFYWTWIISFSLSIYLTHFSHSCELMKELLST